MVSSAAEPAAPLPGLPSAVPSRPAASSLRDDSSIASGSSGFGSLTKKKAGDLTSGSDQDPVSFVSSNITDSGISESSEPLTYSMSTDASSGSANQVTLQPNATAMQMSAQSFTTQTGSAAGAEQGHSRNSSNTSQVSRAAQFLPARA